MATTFPRKRDSIVHILSSLGPGHSPWVGLKPPFLCEEFLGVCGEPDCSMGAVSPCGGQPWLQLAASGLSIWAFFPFPLCARPCPRCGGYCQGESDKNTPGPTVRSAGGLWESGASLSPGRPWGKS